jgi:hypothetical protein
VREVSIGQERAIWERVQPGALTMPILQSLSSFVKYAVGVEELIRSIQTIQSVLGDENENERLLYFTRDSSVNALNT